MKEQWRPAFLVFALLTLLTGVIYPVVVTLFAQVVFPYQSNGGIIEANGKAVGSNLIGQHFDDPRYFWGRPSATGPFSYNSASSTGSNQGPTNPALMDAVCNRVEATRKAHPDQAGPVPVELVTASGSGLDPHISPAAAEFQVTRIAKARGLEADDLRRLIAEHIEGRTFGILGEPRVNVLQLNFALDEWTTQ